MAKPHYTAKTYVARRSIGYLAKRLNNLSTARVEALFANDDLTFSHWVALITLRDGVAETCADIARHMNHDSGATTRLIDQLEARGLVARTRSKEDRRVVQISLTPDGLAMVRALTPRVMDFWNAILADFSPAEFNTLVDLLTRLAARVEREPVVAAPVAIALPRKATR